MYRIVVVDDEYIVVEGIKAIIRKRNMDCEVVGFANDGISGLDEVSRWKPDILITDIRMPGMDGLSLIEVVKEEFPKVRFVIISGYTEFAYARRAITLGVKGYIDKPITMEKLEDVIKKLIREDESEKDESQWYEHFLGSMMDAVLNENPKELEKECALYLEKLNDHTEHVELYKRECFHILAVLLELLCEKKKCRENWMHISYSEIEQLDTVIEIKEYIQSLVKKIAMALEHSRLTTNHYIVNKLLQFIAENYNRDIGLTELAEVVNMNPSYLCILFKEEVGMSYVKYLTNLRINKAKEFLTEGYKVVDVSEMVGYNNYRYFCDIFKKNMGVTPSEFRGGVRKR